MEKGARYIWQTAIFLFFVADEMNGLCGSVITLWDVPQFVLLLQNALGHKLNTHNTFCNIIANCGQSRCEPTRLTLACQSHGCFLLLPKYLAHVVGKFGIGTCVQDVPTLNSVHNVYIQPTIISRLYSTAMIMIRQ